MEKKYKVVLYIFIGIFVLMTLVFFANKMVKQKIKAGIEKELSRSHVEYEEITVDIVSGSSTVSHPKLKLGSAAISAEELQVLDLDYREYFANKKIVFDRIVFENPEILINKADTLQKPKNKDSNEDFEEDIKIKHVVILDGTLKIVENDTVDNGLYVSLKSMDIYDLHITPKSLKYKIPFNFSEVSINSDSLYYALNPEHELYIDNLDLKKGNLQISALKIIPKFSKVTFDSRQKVEKDRFELEVPLIEMKDFKWGFNGDKLHLESAKTSIKDAALQVYRNKLLPDDNSFKPLYSKKLRDLETKLKFDDIKLSNAKVVYEEKSLEGKPPGKVMFTNMEVSVTNLSNVNLKQKDFPETSIKAKANFMGKSKLDFNMKFNITDVEDKFNFSGNLAGISGDAMNSFLKPALNIEVQGKISSMYFNFFGDNARALGDTRLQYHDFKVEVLKKDGRSKNKILSGLANLILKNKVSNKKMNQKNIVAIRDKTKSFWNFMWLCIRNGALKSFI